MTETQLKLSRKGNLVPAAVRATGGMSFTAEPASPGGSAVRQQSPAWGPDGRGSSLDPPESPVTVASAEGESPVAPAISGGGVWP